MAFHPHPRLSDLGQQILFAKKYFNDPELSSYVDELYQQVDFQDAIADPDTGGIYMIINSDGSGQKVGRHKAHVPEDISYF